MIIRINSAKCMPHGTAGVTVEVDITPGMGIHMRGVPGGLSMAQYARGAGFKACILSCDSASEASALEGIKVYRAHTLQDAICIIKGGGDTVKPVA